MADALTIVGAVTGPLALGWHIWTWWYRQRLSVHITAWPDRSDPLVGGVDGRTFSADSPVVRVRVVNRGGRTTKIEEVGWVDPTVEARGNHLAFEDADEMELGRHDGETFDVPRGKLDHADLSEGQTFYVRLATGETLHARGIEVERSMAAGRNPPVRAKEKPPIRRRLRSWWFVNRGRVRWWLWGRWRS